MALVKEKQKAESADKKRNNEFLQIVIDKDLDIDFSTTMVCTITLPEDIPEDIKFCQHMLRLREVIESAAKKEEDLYLGINLLFNEFEDRLISFIKGE